MALRRLVAGRALDFEQELCMHMHMCITRESRILATRCARTASGLCNRRWIGILAFPWRSVLKHLIHMSCIDEYESPLLGFGVGHPLRFFTHALFEWNFM